MKAKLQHMLRSDSLSAAAVLDVGAVLILGVAKTEELRIQRHSPDSIRQKLSELAQEKQRELDLAFYWMLGGLVATFVLVALRMKLS